MTDTELAEAFAVFADEAQKWATLVADVVPESWPSE